VAAEEQAGERLGGKLMALSSHHIHQYAVGRLPHWGHQGAHLPMEGGGAGWPGGVTRPYMGGCGRWPAGALPRWLPFLVKGRHPLVPGGSQWGCRP
jgi:hypothetical protein